MSKELENEIERFLAYYMVERDDELAKDVRNLVQKAYSLGWSDAKDDSMEEEGLCSGEED
jgi:hypothetical protein